MTRAKDGLHLIMPQRFFTHGQAARGDRHVYASRSRFIPSSILGNFEQTSWPAGRAAEDPRRQPQVRVDIGARMRGMWK
jgi:DNA helicase-2/ATP-dependent DNA helicase PcrA